MAFTDKIDFAGFATTFSSALGIRDDNPNNTQETYIPQGQDGSFVTIETYGEDASPNNNYVVKGNLSPTADQIKLGAITSVTPHGASAAKSYALESINISTGAGTAPTFVVNSQMVESGATMENYYGVPAFSLLKAHVAQNLFSSFTLPASGCTLTACNAAISASVDKDKLVGVTVASDVSGGFIEVTGTILQTGSSAPTVTAASGWTLTKPLVCTNPETAYPSWSFTVRKNLTKSAVS